MIGNFPSQNGMKPKPASKVNTMKDCWCPCLDMSEPFDVSFWAFQLGRVRLPRCPSTGHKGWNAYRRSCPWTSGVKPPDGETVTNMGAKVVFHHSKKHCFTEQSENDFILLDLQHQEQDCSCFGPSCEPDFLEIHPFHLVDRKTPYDHRDEQIMTQTNDHVCMLCSNLVR